MGSSVLSEVDDTSILRTGLSTRYCRSLNWLPASRLLLPRSGLERSDFVHWPIASVGCDAAISPEPGAKQTCRAHAGSDVIGRVEMWRGGGRSNISVFRLFRLAVPYWFSRGSVSTS